MFALNSFSLTAIRFSTFLLLALVALFFVFCSAVLRMVLSLSFSTGHSKLQALNALPVGSCSCRTSRPCPQRSICKIRFRITFSVSPLYRCLWGPQSSRRNTILISFRLLEPGVLNEFSTLLLVAFNAKNFVFPCMKSSRCLVCYIY